MQTIVSIARGSKASGQKVTKQTKGVADKPEAVSAGPKPASGRKTGSAGKPGNQQKTASPVARQPPPDAAPTEETLPVKARGKKGIQNRLFVTLSTQHLLSSAIVDAKSLD